MRVMSLRGREIASREVSPACAQPGVPMPMPVPPTARRSQSPSLPYRAAARLAEKDSGLAWRAYTGLSCLIGSGPGGPDLAEERWHTVGDGVSSPADKGLQFILSLYL
jgi:hypothetical protein